MNQFLHTLSLNHRKVFLIDGLGALTTAILLTIIKTFFTDHFGMPPSTFTILAAIAFLYCCFSLVCHFSTKTKWKTNLRIIGVANVLYCCLTGGLVMCHYKEMSAWGIAYFLIEIIIITTLSVFEFKIASSLSGTG